MIRFHASDDRVLAIRYCLDGRRVAIASGPSVTWTGLAFWDLGTAVQLVQNELPQRVLAVSHDLSLLVIRDANSRLRILDPFTLKRRFFQPQSRRSFASAHFEPNSSRLFAFAYFSEAPHIRSLVFDYGDGSEVVDDWCDQPYAFSVFRFDGRIIAFLTFDGVEVREWETNRRIAKWPADELTTDMMFTPDGAAMALWHQDYVQLWDIATSTQRFALVGHQGMV